MFTLMQIRTGETIIQIFNFILNGNGIDTI